MRKHIINATEPNPSGTSQGWLNLEEIARVERLDDGSEEEFGAEVSLIPPGHDAWIVGDEPFVALDITGMGSYAKPA